MLIQLPSMVDRRGKLLVMECGKHVPFPIQRVFVLHGLTAGFERGNHAHRACHEFLVVFSGALTVDLDDGSTRRRHRLADCNQGLHIPPMNWIALRDFDGSTICMVLASEPYDASDYIHSYEEFVGLVTGAIP